MTISTILSVTLALISPVAGSGVAAAPSGLATLSVPMATASLRDAVAPLASGRFAELDPGVEFARAVRGALRQGGSVVQVNTEWGDEVDRTISVRVVVARSRFTFAYVLEFSDWGQPPMRHYQSLVNASASERPVDASALISALKSGAPTGFFADCGDAYLVIGDLYVSLDDPSWAALVDDGEDQAMADDGEETQLDEYEESGCGC